MRISDWSSDVCSSDRKEPHMRYIIALYEIDRAYGGAEEGGWWYDTGELARLLALAPTEARAIQLADRANRLLERLQRHRRRVDSVLYAGGRYTAIVFEWTAPPAFPVVRPHYAGTRLSAVDGPQ